MTTWVLIILMTGNSSGIATIEYSSQQKCLIAASKILKRQNESWHSYCIEKD